MATYSDYREPGISVFIERQTGEEVVERQNFYPVFIGTGMTSSSRDMAFNDVQADVSEFPKVTLTVNFSDLISKSLYKTTDFAVKSLAVKQSNSPVPLTVTTDYTVTTGISTIGDDGKASLTVTIIKEEVADTDLLYNLVLTATNGDDDFDVKLLKSEDQFIARQVTGPFYLTEGGSTIRNDIAIATEIAFRLKVPAFYFMEVKRAYGSAAEAEDIVAALENVYFKRNAYRIVVLTDDVTVSSAVRDFVEAISNPTDKRETVGFVSYPAGSITNMDDMDELETEVGGFSASLNSTRVVNVFGGASVSLSLDGVLRTLPWFFMNVAVASMDTVLGMAAALSTREVTVFDSIDAPRFRPAVWNRLAKKGVWIIKQDDKEKPPVIRHQLTTSQSGKAADEEYSIVKNIDAITAVYRDRLAPYAGKYTIIPGFLDKLNSATTLATQEVIERGLAASMTQVSPWALREVPVNEGSAELKRNLVTRFKPELAYPDNNLDIYLLI